MSRGGGGRGSGKKRGTGDKTDAFWESIETENVKTLFWSLKYGGFTATRPYDDENTPPIHYAVKTEKAKSLKCILETVDRMRAQKDVDFPWEDEDNLTPLMVAAQQNWAVGARILLENGADLARKDAKGKTALQHATECESKGILKLFKEWVNPEPEPEMSDAEKAKKAEIVARLREESDKRAAEQRAHIEDLAKKLEEKDNLHEVLKQAASAAAWPEVSGALAAARRELNISKLEADDATTEVDPQLWKVITLQKLHLRLKKDILTELPATLGQLTALTELNLSNNSLRALPESIGELSALKILAVEANCLTTLPEGISQCKKLEVVNFMFNQLVSVAPMGPLAPSLLIVHLSHNQLPVLEVPLEKCARLGTLTISHNKLTAMPPHIGGLQKLKVLKMAHNQITEVPDDMSELKELMEIDLEGNPFKDKKIHKILEGGPGHNPVKDFRTYLGKGKKKK